MTEIIIRLTDGQEAVVRRLIQGEDVDLDVVTDYLDDVADQIENAIALYDRLVAEAKAAPDE